MAKASSALTQMPPSTVAALEQLGADLAVARLRRKDQTSTSIEPDLAALRSAIRGRK